MRSSVAVALALLLAAPLAVSRAGAQVVPVGPSTQVRSVSFDVPPGTAVSEEDLLESVAIRGRGEIGFRRTLSWVPFVPPVEDLPFDPAELQRDRERLRRLLVRVGYPLASVDYEVSRVADEDAVDVLFHARPGPPLLVRSVAVEWTDGERSGLPDAGRAEAVVQSEGGVAVGRPLDERRVPAAAVALSRWLGNEGYPFAAVRPDVAVDSDASEAGVVLRAAVGPRARIGRVEIEGNRTLPVSFVREVADVAPGEWFSPDGLDAASSRLVAMDVVEGASFEIPSDQPPDTVVDLLLRVRESLPRSVSAQAGYSTEGGLGGEAQWSHLNIFGGGQALTASLSGESGLLALPENFSRYVRGSLTLRQPVLDRAHLSLHVGPFAEFRDDYRDRSLQLGVEATLLYQIGALSSIALRYELSTRRIYQYRFGDIGGGIDFLQLLQSSAEGILDELGGRINGSVLSLSGSFGSLDVPTEPRRGFVIQPSVAITVPPGLTSTQYTTANVRATGYLPLTDGVTLAVRGGAGRLFPFGKSVPPSLDLGLREYFRLRDVLFTAGGSNDVRGWPTHLLGPKVPRFLLTVEDGTPTITADKFVPIGGFNRVHGTVELRLPVPLLGPSWGSHVFVDTGRIWTDDERFTDSKDPYGVEKLFWSTGVGVDYRTVLGSLRVSVGYKLNPSVIDLADPEEMTQAVIAGTPLEELPQHAGRRFQVHLSFGRRL